MQLGQVGVLQGLLHCDALAGVKLEHALHQVYRLGRGIWIHRPEVDPLHQQSTSSVALEVCFVRVQQLCLSS